jgi:hypothetical protein
MKSRMHTFLVSCGLSVFDFFIVTAVFHDKWNIWRAIIISLAVATLLLLTGHYDESGKKSSKKPGQKGIKKTIQKDIKNTEEKIQPLRQSISAQKETEKQKHNQSAQVTSPQKKIGIAELVQKKMDDSKNKNKNRPQTMLNPELQSTDPNTPEEPTLKPVNIRKRKG